MDPDYNTGTVVDSIFGVIRLWNDLEYWIKKYSVGFNISI